MKKYILILVGLTIALSGFAQTISASFKSEVNQVFLRYLDLENAAEKGNPATIQTKANALLAATRLVKTDDLSYAQTNNFNKYFILVTANAELMTKNTRLDSQLKQFNTITSGLYSIMKEFKISDQPVYYNYCPKAIAGNGAYWLNNDAALKNPYFHGDVMGCEKQQEKF